MNNLDHLLKKNRLWSEQIQQQDPKFFEKLSLQQSPEYLWIGCSDSRVPANELVGLLPGELFVHRNIANIVVHSDLNCLSVLQFAVEVLRVRHIIVTGHYGCGGVQAALKKTRLGLSDNWIRHVEDVRQKHQRVLDELQGNNTAFDRLCELNVIEQVVNVSNTTILRDAWERGQELSVHGWIYSLQEGLLSDLKVTMTHSDEIEPVYHRAISTLGVIS